jgi:hypothetical protein
MLEANMNDNGDTPKSDNHQAKVTNGPGSLGFAHRTNRDGTFDSICLRCFHTAVSTFDESLLESLEADHR